MRGEKMRREETPWSDDKEVNRPPTPEEAKALGERLDELGIDDEALSELKAEAEKEDMESVGEEIDEEIEKLDAEAAEGAGGKDYEKAADGVKAKILKEVGYLRKLTKTSSKDELAKIEAKLQDRLGAVKRIDDHMMRAARFSVEEAGKKEREEKPPGAPERSETTKVAPQKKSLLGRITGLLKK